MSLSQLLEHLESIEISERVAQAVGMVARDYDATPVPGWSMSSFEMRVARLSDAVQNRGHRES